MQQIALHSTPCIYPAGQTQHISDQKALLQTVHRSAGQRELPPNRCGEIFDCPAISRRHLQDRRVATLTGAPSPGKLIT